MLEKIIEYFKNNYKIILKSIFTFILFWYSSYLRYIPVIIFHLNKQSLTTTIQVYLSIFSSTILASLFLILYWKDLKKEFTVFCKKFVDNMDVGVRYWLFGLIVMMISNLLLSVVFKAGGAENEKAIQEMISKLPWAMFISAGILAPFNEEIAFRKTLKDIFTNKWIFAFFSFLLFGGAHVIGTASNILDYLYIIPYGALGASFALAYYETDTIFTSLSLHMFHNIVLSLLSILIL